MTFRFLPIRFSKFRVGNVEYVQLAFYRGNRDLSVQRISNHAIYYEDSSCVFSKYKVSKVGTRDEGSVPYERLPTVIVTHVAKEENVVRNAFSVVHWLLYLNQLPYRNVGVNRVITQFITVYVRPCGAKDVIVLYPAYLSQDRRLVRAFTGNLFPSNRHGRVKRVLQGVPMVLPDISFHREVTAIHSVLVKIRERCPLTFTIPQLRRPNFKVVRITMVNQALRRVNVVKILTRVLNRLNNAPIVGALFRHCQGKLYLRVFQRVAMFIPRVRQEVRVQDNRALPCHLMYFLCVCSKRAFRGNVRRRQGNVISGRAVVILAPWLPSKRVSMMVVLTGRTIRGVHKAAKFRSNVWKVDHAVDIPRKRDAMILLSIQVACHVVHHRVVTVRVQRSVELGRHVVRDHVRGFLFLLIHFCLCLAGFTVPDLVHLCFCLFGTFSRGFYLPIRANVLCQGQEGNRSALRHFLIPRVRGDSRVYPVYCGGIVVRSVAIVGHYNGRQF